MAKRFWLTVTNRVHAQSLLQFISAQTLKRGNMNNLRNQRIVEQKEDKLLKLTYQEEIIEEENFTLVLSDSLFSIYILDFVQPAKANESPMQNSQLL